MIVLFLFLFVLIKGVHVHFGTFSTQLSLKESGSGFEFFGEIRGVLKELLRK